MKSTRLRTFAFPSIFIGFALACVGACGGGSGQLPTPGADLMAATTVGKFRCELGKDNDRPFVVEWDSTDLANFESKAQRDIVFVKIDGCNLKVLDCRDDGIPGKYGAYDATHWTTGSVEGFDIKNEGELYAKLPLGAVSLSGQVKAGNSLHLKYFVSGTTPSGRNSVYRGDIEKNPLCKSATHFVAGYDLGAFEVTTSEQNSEEAKVGFHDIGGGGSHSHQQSHLKEAGKLGDCTADTAKDLARCKVPIRLSLREVTDGENPTPPTDQNVTAPAIPTGPSAGMSPIEQVQALMMSATRKMQLKDGNGCLMDLDRILQVDPNFEKKPGNNAMIRAQCEMIAGKCDQGKKRYRVALEAAAPQLTPEQLDSSVKNQAATLCVAGQGTPAEKAQRAYQAIVQANFKKDAATCANQGNTIMNLLPSWTTKDDDEERDRWSNGVSALKSAAECVARHGGDCSIGKTLYNKYVDELVKKYPPKTNVEGATAHMKDAYKCPVPKRD
jgi:hypothetical protein